MRRCKERGELAAVTFRTEMKKTCSTKKLANFVQVLGILDNTCKPNLVPKF